MECPRDTERTALSGTETKNCWSVGASAPAAGSNSMRWSKRNDEDNGDDGDDKEWTPRICAAASLDVFIDD